MDKKFFKIHKQTIKSNQETFQVIKISDVTDNIRFCLIAGEKKVLQMINACVSHEMRSPIHSMYSMFLKMKQIVKDVIKMTSGYSVSDNWILR